MDKIKFLFLFLGFLIFLLCMDFLGGIFNLTSKCFFNYYYIFNTKNMNHYFSIDAYR